MCGKREASRFWKAGLAEKKKEYFKMKQKRCIIIGLVICLIIGSMAGCSSKGDGSSLKGDGSSLKGDGSSLKGDGSSLKGDGGSSKGNASNSKGEGSGSKEDWNNQISQGIQPIEIKQAEETINENEEVQNKETQNQDAQSEKGQNEEAQGENAFNEEEQSAEAQSEEKPKLTTITADYTEAFQSMHGCAVIFDAGNNSYTFFNEEECRIRVSPDSTFKVISTLIGLHNQVITAGESKMNYDGTHYPVDAWNADLSLTEAFQSSCVWYFRRVIDKVGQETVQEELDQLGYGNCDISEWGGSGVNSFPELNGFWLDSSLMISPIEQVEILRNIVEGKTIYTESEIEILKSIMLLETRDSDGSYRETGTVDGVFGETGAADRVYGETGAADKLYGKAETADRLYGKTGTGTNGTAWFIGFAECGNGNLYFAVHLDDDTSNEVNGAKAREIAFDILGY